MSTIIAIKENDKFTYIWSGDYGDIGVFGKELRKYYNNTDYVRNLIQSGKFKYHMECDDERKNEFNQEPKIVDDFEEFLRNEKDNLGLIHAYYFDIGDNNWYVYQNLHKKLERGKLDDAIIERFLMD